MAEKIEGIKLQTMKEYLTGGNPKPLPPQEVYHPPIKERKEILLPQEAPQQELKEKRETL